MPDEIILILFTVTVIVTAIAIAIIILRQEIKSFIFNNYPAKSIERKIAWYLADEPVGRVG